MQKLCAIFADFGLLIIIFTVMISALAFGSYLPTDVQRLAVTISATTRNILMYCLPFLVLPFIVNSIQLLKSNGLILVIALIGLMILSNFIAILIGGGVAALFVPFLKMNTTFSQGDATALEPFFELGLTPLINIEMVLVIGFALGFLLSIYRNQKLLNFFSQYKKISTTFFHKIFIPILPLYIFGTLIKLDAENDFYTVFRDFGSVIIMIILTQVMYIIGMFWVGTNFSFTRTIVCIKNCLPAGLLGFSTMSSLVTMPVTLEATEKNLADKEVADIAITTTVSAHVVGECIALSVLAVAVYLMGHGMVLPDFITFSKFALILAVSQLTGVAVPGGSAVVCLPVLTCYLGFSPEMIGLVAMLEIFIDPLNTAANVMSNSAFALIIQKFFRFFAQRPA